MLASTKNKRARGPGKEIRMEYFEKVEKLVQKAGVSYEEAKAALDASNGDLLDAMIMLERAGKTAGPQKSTYSTRYEDQTQYVSVTERIEQGNEAEGESAGQKIKEILGRIWHVLSRNFLAICRSGETLIKLPLWVALIILFASWFTVLVVVVVSLFFGCRYRFVGEADMQAANDIMDKAANAADKAKEEFKN